MVCDRDHRESGLPGAIHELAWSAPPVGRSGVKVKVDSGHRAARAGDEPCRSGRRGRR